MGNKTVPEIPHKFHPKKRVWGVGKDSIFLGDGGSCYWENQNDIIPYYYTSGYTMPLLRRKKAEGIRAERDLRLYQFYTWIRPFRSVLVVGKRKGGGGVQ